MYANEATGDITVLTDSLDAPSTTEVLYDNHSDISGLRYIYESQEPCNLEGTGTVQQMFTF